MRGNVGWLGAVTIGAALLVTGCSKSSMQLLKEGDAHVCTKSDVTSQLFEIIKQNAATPDYSKLFPDDSADRIKGWTNKVAFTIDGVTSKDVDAPNEKITCNGTVHMSASGIEKEQTANVDYQVTGDLSANKAVTTVSIGSSGYALGQIIQALAAPDVKKAQDQKAAADQAKMADYEKQWAQYHAADIAATRNNIKAKYSTEASWVATGSYDLQPDSWPRSKLFTPSDQALMVRAETVKAMCLQNMAVADNIVCSQRDKLFDSLKEKDICYDGDSWFHCSKRVPPSPAVANSGPFTPAETAVVNQAQDLTDRCRDAEGAQNPQICDQSQAAVQRLKTMNICYGPEDAIEADKHWVRCSS